MLAGLFTSIVVAWACELGRACVQADAVGTRGGTTATSCSYEPLEQRMRLLRIRTRWPGCEEWIQSYFDPLTVYPLYWPDEGIAPPSWAPTPDGQEQRQRGAIAYGLPWLCMRSRLDGYTPSTPLQWAGRQGHLSVYLPVVPITSGLCLNTVFYSAFFALRLAIGPLGRHRRLRRGHCPLCNYDLVFDYSRPCPECGASSGRTR